MDQKNVAKRYTWDGSRNLPDWMGGRYAWAQGSLVIHTTDGPAIPEKGWMFVLWDDGELNVASPMVAARCYGENGLLERLKEAEKKIRDLESKEVTTNGRGVVSELLWKTAEHTVVAEWVCCDPINPKHTLCTQGGEALKMLHSLLVDSPDSWKPAPLLDEVMKLMKPVTGEEKYRLFLSMQLDLGTSAPWDAIVDRVISLTEQIKRQQQKTLKNAHTWPEMTEPDTEAAAEALKTGGAIGLMAYVQTAVQDHVRKLAVEGATRTVKALQDAAEAAEKAKEDGK